MLDFQRLVRIWDRAAAVPGGKKVFSRLVKIFIPYTGTMSADIEAMERGYARIRLRDHRTVRNHLQSIHAMALANLGEMSSGIALNTALPSDARAILTGFSVKYLKKGRGDLTVECRVPIVDAVTERKTFKVPASIKDSAGEEIATVEAEWLVGPKKKKEGP